MDISGPRDVARYIYMAVPDAHWHAGSDTMHDCPSVTANGYVCEIGDDPSYPGVIWTVLIDDDDREVIDFGGWVPGDTDTAAREIARAIAVLSGGY